MYSTHRRRRAHPSLSETLYISALFRAIWSFAITLSPYAMSSPSSWAYQALDLLPSASPADVRLAYKRLSLATHPDKTRNPTSRARFDQVNSAYTFLSDNLFGRETHTPTVSHVVTDVITVSEMEENDGDLYYSCRCATEIATSLAAILFVIPITALPRGRPPMFNSVHGFAAQNSPAPHQDIIPPSSLYQHPTRFSFHLRNLSQLFSTQGPRCSACSPEQRATSIQLLYKVQLVPGCRLGKDVSLKHADPLGVLNRLLLSQMRIRQSDAAQSCTLAVGHSYNLVLSFLWYFTSFV
ncbi:unnamed protein product [Agarophyton chilense]